MADMNKIMSETAAVMGAGGLKVMPSEVNYAETDGETLFFNPSFISSLEASAGEDGVRFVVAHELGHQLGGMEHGGHSGEFMADEYATRALAQMGADFEAIAGVFTVLTSNGSETHPATGTRAGTAKEVFRAERRVVDAQEEEIDIDRGARTNPNIKDWTL